MACLRVCDIAKKQDVCANSSACPAASATRFVEACMPSRTRSSKPRATASTLRNPPFYITTEPCSVCAKMLINAGIKEIVFATAYPDKLSEELLGETDILIRCVEYSE